MLDAEIVAEYRTAHRAALVEDVGGQQREHAARRGEPAQDVVLCAYRHGLRLGRIGLAVQARADGFAGVAADAQVRIDDRIGKTLVICLHGDAVLRAD